MSRDEYWERITAARDKLNNIYMEYWNQYANAGTWPFWTNVLLLIAPLILLFYMVDRRRIFEVLFYGFAFHIQYAYIDIALDRYNLLVHPYPLLPVVPVGMIVTASLLPAFYLLLYQHCTRTGRSFYLYAVLLSAVFGIGFASLSEWLGLLRFGRGMNFFHLFLIDIAVAYTSYGVTRLVLRLHRHGQGKEQAA